MRLVLYHHVPIFHSPCRCGVHMVIVLVFMENLNPQARTIGHFRAGFESRPRAFSCCRKPCTHFKLSNIQHPIYMPFQAFSPFSEYASSLIFLPESHNAPQPLRARLPAAGKSVKELLSVCIGLKWELLISILFRAAFARRIMRRGGPIRIQSTQGVMRSRLCWLSFHGC